VPALSPTLGPLTLTAYDKTLAAVSITPIGAFGFSTVPPPRKRVLGQTADAATPASVVTVVTVVTAVTVGAFNPGNAPTRLGGVVPAAGPGVTAPDRGGALLAASALVLTALPARLERRTGGRGSRIAVASSPAAGAARAARRASGRNGRGPPRAVPVAVFRRRIVCACRWCHAHNTAG
jgi:DHA1 family inner membrane transport protein